MLWQDPLPLGIDQSLCSVCGALLRKGLLRDSSRESSVVAGLHEQTDPAELQDQELAGLQ
jgi:hypothetical protein